MIEERPGKNGGDRVQAQLPLAALYEKKKKGKPRTDPENQILPVDPFLSVGDSLSADPQDVIHSAGAGAEGGHLPQQHQLPPDMTGDLH